MNILRNLKKRLKNNLSLAIYAAIISIIAWFTISVTLYPSTSQTFENIPLDIDAATNDIAESGLSLISCDVASVNVRIKGSRLEVGNLSGDNLTARLVTDNISTSGTKKVSIEIVCTDPGIDFTVESVSPENASVVIDKYDTRTFQVTPEIPNVTFGEGKTISIEDFVCEPDTISITGPSAQLDKIDKVAAVSNKVIQLDSSYTFNSDEIMLYTEEGTTIDQSALKFDTSSFLINVPVLTQKTIDLSVGIAGAPSNFNSDFLKFTLSSSSITLASLNGQLSDFPNTFEVGKIRLSDLSLGYTKTFTIDTGNYKNMSNLDTVTVTLDDSDLGSKNFVITDFNITNASDNYDFEVVTQSLEVSIIGPKDVIEEITTGDIVADINLLNADKLTESETFNWDVTISFPQYDNVWAVTQSKATVRKTAKNTQDSSSDDEDEDTDND